MHALSTSQASPGPSAGHRAARLRLQLAALLPGLALSGALAATGIALGHIGWLQDHGFSALTLAIVLGMIVGNTVYPLVPRLAAASGAGVNVSKQNLLRLGVVLYGLRLTVQDIGHVGIAGVAIDALVLGSTFALACFIGTRWLGLDRKTAMLIGTGSSICGAAAVMAAEPVVKARAEQVTVAVATVVVFLLLLLRFFFFHPQPTRLAPWGGRVGARTPPSSSCQRCSSGKPARKASSGLRTAPPPSLSTWV